MIQAFKIRLLLVFIFVGFFAYGASDTHAYTAGAFVTTWDTTNAGSVATDIVIPITGLGYDFVVDWGDSATTSYSGDIFGVSHRYATSGVKTIEITGDFPSIYFNDGGDKAKILTVEQWGDIAWTSMSRAFWGALNLEGNASDAPDLSAVSDMSFMFYGAASFNQAVDSWDVSGVTDMSFMFNGASSFDQDLSGWDVSQVTGFSGDGGGFLDGSGISDLNYTRLLDGWSQLTLQNRRNFGDVPASYYSTSQDARDIITDTYSWTIVDSGSVQVYELTYLPGTNASLIGSGSQVVLSGVDGTTVTVVPDKDYTFVRWSDGVKDNPRTDLSASANVSVTATLQRNSRSGGHIVRILENRAEKENEKRQEESIQKTSTPLTAKAVRQVAQMTAYAIQHPREFLEKALLLLEALSELLSLLSEAEMIEADKVTSVQQ